MEYDILFSFIASLAILAISPGPDNIFVLMQSVVHGKKYGLATVAGLMTGCIIHTTLVAFGVSVIIKENENIFLGIKVLGAAYLIYLAYKVFRSPADISMNSGSGDLEINYNGNEIDAYVEMRAKRERKIIAPFKFDKSREVEKRWGSYFEKTAKVGKGSIEIEMHTGSGKVEIVK